MTQEYQLRDLGPLGAEIHHGRQGIIYTIPQNPSLVFKRYIDTKKTDKITLSALIDWPAGLSRAEQAFLQDSTAWPNALVWEGQHLVGVTMPRAPERFTFRATDGKSRSTTLSIAIDQERTHIRQHIPVPNQTQRLWLAYNLCRLLALFERNGIIYLDLSSKNILWSLDPKPAVFLVDCDSAIPVWRLNSAQRVRTGNLYDPWYQDPPSHEEIRGLFSLIFARLVFAKDYANFKSRLILEPPDNPFAKSFQAIVDVGYSPDFAQRPNFETWQMLIEETLGIKHTPVKKTPKRSPTSTITPQPGKEIYDKHKKIVSVKYKLGSALIFLDNHQKGIVSTAAILLFIIMMKIAIENQPYFPESLYESTWKNNFPVQCGKHDSRAGLLIYASGEGNDRKMKVEISQDFGTQETYYIIKSGVAYRWTNKSNRRGYKTHIYETAIEKFLGSYQETYSSGILTCGVWLEVNDTLFELPAHVNFFNN